MILWILFFFVFLMMSKGKESVCLCFVLKLFQPIQLQNKGEDIQDRGSFVVQTLSKESVCLCFVLKLFQAIQLQNKGEDIQDRGSCVVLTLSKGYGLSSSKRGRL